MVVASISSPHTQERGRRLRSGPVRLDDVALTKSAAAEQQESPAVPKVPRVASRPNRDHVLACQHHAVERVDSHAESEFLPDLFNRLDVSLPGTGNVSLTASVQVGLQATDLARQGEHDDAG